MKEKNLPEMQPCELVPKEQSSAGLELEGNLHP